MRQADSTIKGYLYQFNKSLLEMLSSDENTSVILEGVIEDIDIHSATESQPYNANITKTVSIKFQASLRLFL